RAIAVATGGVGRCWEITSNSWEYTGDGIAMALAAGAELIDMEMVQFHPTGMVWPPSVRGILVTEGVRGDGGTLRNSDGTRFMFNYIPDFFKAETADNEAEADAWYTDNTNNPRTPDLLPRRHESARETSATTRPAGAPPQGGFSPAPPPGGDPTTPPPRPPSIPPHLNHPPTATTPAPPMEIAPPCHYIMGGVRVDADTA